MSGKRNVSVCSGHELANALYSNGVKAYTKVTFLPRASF